MADPPSESALGTARLRFLTFRVDERLYALPADEVTEVIRTPAVARVPQAPSALLGLANLRGDVLPIASARGLLGKPERAGGRSDRTIVLAGGAPAGLAVDGIEGLSTVEAEGLAREPAELAAEAGETLAGAFRRGGTDVVRVLDIRQMLAGAFAPRARLQRGGYRAGGAENRLVEEEEARERLVTFDVAGQTYALPLDSVREIIAAPDEVTATPGADAALIGMVPYRDTLLPLLSLRGLLGFAAVGPGDARAKVLVVRVGETLVGLIADQAREVLSAESASVEAAPAMLAARTGGEAKVHAIYRAKGGGRLVSILAPAKLFREDVMARLTAASRSGAAADGEVRASEQRQYVVFRLGADEFGLPVDAVDEVARAPAKVVKVPKTPRFIEGVMNLRGEVLPVIDQRRRFDMPPADDLGTRRLIVLRTQRHRAGVIVDSVSEVLHCEAGDIGEAPDLAGEPNRLVNGVLNLEQGGRLVMLLDPSELLTRAELGMLDAFKAGTDKAGA